MRVNITRPLMFKSLYLVFSLIGCETTNRNVLFEKGDEIEIKYSFYQTNASLPYILQYKENYGFVLNHFIKDVNLVSKQTGKKYIFHRDISLKFVYELNLDKDDTVGADVVDDQNDEPEKIVYFYMDTSDTDASYKVVVDENEQTINFIENSDKISYIVLDKKTKTASDLKKLSEFNYKLNNFVVFDTDRFNISSTNGFYDKTVNGILVKPIKLQLTTSNPPFARENEFYCSNA